MKEQILKELKNKSEVINDSLWYVNPDDIKEAISQTREETIREVEKIELAPDNETFQTINYCKNKSEAFGYGQFWVMKRVEDILNKLKK